MPGRNPAEAVETFIQPLRRAVNVLDGYSKIVVSQRGGYAKGGEYSWVLCPINGMTLKGLGTFEAEMKFKVIDADVQKYEAPVRITTLAYRYKLTDNDGDTLWMFHWHPTGNSPYTEPHTHQPPDLGRHLPNRQDHLREGDRLVHRVRRSDARNQERGDRRARPLRSTAPAVPVVE